MTHILSGRDQGGGLVELMSHKPLSIPTFLYTTKEHIELTC